MRASDTGLRRLAWTLLVLVAAGTAARVLVAAAEHAWTRADGMVSTSGEVGSYVVLVSIPVTGLVILRQQPRNRIGWLLMGIGLTWCVGLVADAYARYGLLVEPGSLPAAGVAALLNAVTWAPGLGLMGTFLLLLFPDGELPSPRWRAVAWFAAVIIAALTATMMLTPGPLAAGPVPALRNPLGVEAAKPLLGPLLLVLIALLPLCILACAAGLVVRFRRSRGIVRLQMKWLATAAAVVAGLYAVSLVASLLTGSLTGDAAEPAWMGLLDAGSFLSFLLLPAAIGTAVLRHNLYGIDLVINRTLVYGSLTLTLGGLYVGSVLLLQPLLSPLTRQSDLAVAGSTLMVAAVFRPVRGRIQSAVDRRFYRSRYDAERTVNAFAHRLRHELDLDALTTDLRATVDETVHPAHVSIWLRP